MKIKAIVVGFGDRGNVYSGYALTNPDDFEIVGVVDANPFKLQQAKERFHLENNQLFSDIDECIKTKPNCDLFINTTMDQIHYKVMKPILEAGYNLLTEKPIVGKKSELLELQAIAKKNNCKVFVCHVLRYTPFYCTIKQMILDNKLGKIISIQMDEHVGIAHYGGSYVRCKWNNEKECGSSFLLAKSCHDIDLMCWLNNSTVPEKVACFGGRYFFIKENAPKGSTERCIDCPHKETCLYEAHRHYITHDWSSNLTWPQINKKPEEITLEDKEKFLADTLYGKCIFKVKEADISDRLALIVNFKDGSIANFNQIGGAPQAGRYIHIVGTTGEIVGNAESGVITYMPASMDSLTCEKIVIDVNKEINTKFGFTGHMGGDYAIMDSVVKYLKYGTESISLTSLDDSINSHLVVFSAEESRKENRIVNIK
ncbi:MAG: Gfo/Idh/MocA family oxidoreductase [Bacilli bacterium]|nr:Gfo/Idh/MocA family oxidoreductase [Bacilli bacterium]